MSTDKHLKITELEVSDVRFPTSFDEHGSDASHSAPDYSAVYVRLITNSSKSDSTKALELSNFYTKISKGWAICSDS